MTWAQSMCEWLDRDPAYLSDDLILVCGAIVTGLGAAFMAFAVSLRFGDIIMLTRRLSFLFQDGTFWQCSVLS